jgi:hypothetical protein
VGKERAKGLKILNYEQWRWVSMYQKERVGVRKLE